MGNAVRITVTFGDGVRVTEVFDEGPDGWDLSSVDKLLRFTSEDTLRVINNNNALTLSSFDLIHSGETLFGSVGALVYLIGERKKVTEYIGMHYLGQKMTDYD